MQRKRFEDKSSFSFTVVDDDDNFDFDESINVENAREIPSPIGSDKDESIDIKNQDQLSMGDLSDNAFDSDDMDKKEVVMNIPNAGLSDKQKIKKIQSPIYPDPKAVSSDSDSDDDISKKKKKSAIPGEYNPAQYENLEANMEVKELFQYITKYIPQHLNVDYRFKPFIPEFLPAVGDIDAFLKIIPPEKSPYGETFDFKQQQLGLTVLDEPAANQSDQALLQLQLRAASVHASQITDMVVKKVDKIENNAKTIEKWIKNINDLHRSRSSPIVKYTDPMPDLDTLMQEWPERLENTLKSQGFPSCKMNGSISDYIKIVCCLFDIPIYKNQIQSLHLLFSLYAAIKNSQLYKANQAENNSNPGEILQTQPDQLVLD